MIFHKPVLLAAVIKWINLRPDDGVYCDCTVGGAGHLMALLKNTKRSKFIGLDWDPDAVAYARNVTLPYKERCFLFEENFINLGLILDRLDIKGVDGVFFDLGVSYYQLTTPARGFSFDRDGRLLMRMSPETQPLSEKICTATKDEIICVLSEYGDVKNGRKIGTAIFQNRHLLKTTLDLRKLVESMVPKRFLKKNLHKVFQALRIWTNNELTNLRKAICIALERLNPQGRILVISYHSGEDRIIKQFFRAAQKDGILRILHKKVLRPSSDEIEDNPRARSAKLRVGEKCVVS